MILCEFNVSAFSKSKFILTLAVNEFGKRSMDNSNYTTKSKKRLIIWCSTIITFGAILYKVFLDGGSILLKHWWYTLPLIIVYFLYKKEKVRRIKVHIVLLVIFNLLFCLQYVLPKSPFVHEINSTYTVRNYSNPTALLSCGTNFYIKKNYWWGYKTRTLVSNQKCFMENDLKLVEIESDTVHLTFNQPGADTLYETNYSFSLKQLFEE